MDAEDSNDVVHSEYAYARHLDAVERLVRHGLAGVDGRGQTHPPEPSALLRPVPELGHGLHDERGRANEDRQREDAGDGLPAQGLARILEQDEAPPEGPAFGLEWDDRQGQQALHVPADLRLGRRRGQGRQGGQHSALRLLGLLKLASSRLLGVRRSSGAQTRLGVELHRAVGSPLFAVVALGLGLVQLDDRLCCFASALQVALQR
mmetsp:Transcript_111125/g.346308  ORF Transcript_111125/g.346308 Transcript_111125/m.346308 type:complete len:206 (-) Transcript_111125:251-868(-)